jgi:hypothetical protein
VTSHNYGKRPAGCRTARGAFGRLLTGSLSALVALPLIFLLGACGTSLSILEAPQKIERLPYLNPPRPDPVVPPEITWKPPQAWAAEKTPAGSLLCIPSQDWIDLRVFHKEVGFWMRQATQALQYHEEQNTPLSAEKLPDIKN